MSSKNSVGGLASSLRSASQQRNANPPQQQQQQQQHQQRHHRQQQQQDAIVPSMEEDNNQYDYMDDSTDEDEEAYASYIEENARNNNNSNNNNNTNSNHRNHNNNNNSSNNGQALNIQQLLHQQQSDDEMGDGALYHQQRQLMSDDMDLDDEDEDMDQQQNINQQQQQQQQQHEEELDVDDQGDSEDEDSDSISLTEDDIDFNLVYAFHTFAATQEGQASVVRNDPLTLLEDTNVYWWLVRVLKTGVIGYIPAENIETPFERLARLNKYRNVGLSAAQTSNSPFPGPDGKRIDDYAPNPKSTNRKSVIFTAQNEFFGASETEWDDEEYDEEDGEWYEEGEEGEEDEEDEEEGAEQEDVHGQADASQASSANDSSASDTAKAALELEAEILAEQEALAKSQNKPTSRTPLKHDSYDMTDDDVVDEDAQDEAEVTTNRYRKPLLDEDEIMLANAEPRKMSLTPAIARDDVDTSSNRAFGSGQKGRRLRFGGEDDEPPATASSSATQKSSAAAAAAADTRSSSFDSEEEEREKNKARMEERTQARMQKFFGEADAGGPRKTKEEYEAGLPPEAPVKKTSNNKVKALFGFGKSSKDKEKDKERKEKERQEKEKLKALASSKNNPRGRSNSNGSIVSNASNNPMSPTNIPQSPPANDDRGGPSNGEEIIALRVYTGNVDFGASMYKTVLVNSSTQAADVASQAVVKFKLAPDGVASTGDFYLTVKDIDGDEKVLQPTDKPMVIYQSLTSHLTTPLPKDHRLSISSVSSMMSVASNSSYSSQVPTPTSPNNVRRIGSGRSDPAQKSIRFFLNKKIRRSNSTSSSPSTPTTAQEDFVWVKVICASQELPHTLAFLDGVGTAVEKSTTQISDMLAKKVEHWIPVPSTANAGDVIFKSLEKIGIRHGVVDGVPEHLLAPVRKAAPHGIVPEYRLSLQLMSQSPRRATSEPVGDEIPLPPQTPLHRCFENHRLVPVRRSLKADVASMPLAPDSVFYLRKSPKSKQIELEFLQAQADQAATKAEKPTKKIPEPLKNRSLQSFSSDPTLANSPTNPDSPRSVRQLRSLDDVGRGEPSAGGPLSPISPTFHTKANGAVSPTPSQSLPAGIRIPRRTDSVILGSTSPIARMSIDSSGRPSPTPSAQAQHQAFQLQQQLQAEQTLQQQHAPEGARTPTPDHTGLSQGRNRSPSVGQHSPSPSARPYQAPSPAPSHMSGLGPSEGQYEEGRSTTPERPMRNERSDRGQRALSPSLSHVPSPLSLSAVMEENSKEIIVDHSSIAADGTKIAPLNIKKNATQGLDIVLNKGVIRSSRLMQSKQYRYSFIPLEGGEEIDISEIIEDILGEDEMDEEDEEEAQIHQAEQVRSMSPRDRTMAAVARANVVQAGMERRRISGGSSQGLSGRTLSNSSGRSRQANPERDILEQLSASARGGDTLLRLERALKNVDAQDEHHADQRQRGLAGTVNAKRLSTQQQQAAQAQAPSPVSTGRPSPVSGRRASPVSDRRGGNMDEDEIQTLDVPSSPASSRKRDSDVEIQVASVVRTNQSASPRSLRPASPFGTARPTVLASAGKSSPLSAGMSEESASVTPQPSSIVAPSSSSPASSSPVPPATSSPALQPSAIPISNNARSLSPLPRRLQTPSPVARASPDLRSQSPSSPLASPKSLRNRSASASVAETHQRFGDGGSRLNKSGINTSNSSGHVSPALSSPGAGSISSQGSKEQWLLSSDYNRGMQDLLTLVRGGRSSSVSSGQMPNNYNNSLGRTGFGRDAAGGAHKNIPLPSAVKAALLAGGPQSVNASSADKADGSYNRSGPLTVYALELRLKDVEQDCHPDVVACWKEVDAELDRMEGELDNLLLALKSTVF